MIPKAITPLSKASNLSVFTPPDDRETELFEEGGIAEQAERVARGFARRRNRGNDKAFIDEATAEALFQVTYMMWTEWESVKEKYPDKAERATFLRMTVGYKLKEYFSLRATSTVSFLRKKGIEIRREQLHEAHLIEYVSPMDVYICFDDVCENELEKRVLEFYAMGQMYELVAVRCGISTNRTKKIINRVRRKLRFPMLPC